MITLIEERIRRRRDPLKAARGDFKKIGRQRAEEVDIISSRRKPPRQQPPASKTATTMDFRRTSRRELSR